MASLLIALQRREEGGAVGREQPRTGCTREDAALGAILCLMHHHAVLLIPRWGATALPVVVRMHESDVSASDLPLTLVQSRETSCRT